MKNTYAIILISVFISFESYLYAQTPVAVHGKLSVAGNQIVDKNGEPVQLRGMSLFWSQWQGKYYNASAVKWLVDDWKVNIIRIAMAVDHEGYAENPKEEMKKVTTVIDAAIASGIYVIVDFHVHEGEKFLEQSKTFFATIAQKYGSYPNVIYEPWNEPVHQSWSDVIKPYHEAVIKTIRQYDPDNLVVCGTRTWSQDVDEASINPIKGDNIAYTLHFYAATHKQALRDKASVALKNGIALMVTEYGTCEASGNGIIDEKETQAWWSFLDQNKISHCNWALSNKMESASALSPNASPSGGWLSDDITTSGNLVRNEIRSKN
jgi:endoglucanase